jgi:iron complex transport system substrate-binding protein
MPLRILTVFLASILFAPLCAGDLRVVSLSSPLAETMYSLGAQASLVGVTDVCVFPEQILKDREAGKVKVVGAFAKPDLAAIDALHPNLILTSTAFQTGLAETLSKKGYKVLHFEPHSLNDVIEQVNVIGSAVGKQKVALRFTTAMRSQLASVLSKSRPLPRVKLYMEINHEGPWTSGSNSPIEELIEAAGGENIFADRHEGVFVTSNEEIIRRNPEVILSPIWLNAKVGGVDGVIPLASIFSRPGYSAIRAVQNSRVLYYDSALMKHEGPREVLAIRKLAYLLHPDVFENPPETIPWELGPTIGAKLFGLEATWMWADPVARLPEERCRSSWHT